MERKRQDVERNTTKYNTDFPGWWSLAGEEVGTANAKKSSRWGTNQIIMIMDKSKKSKQHIQYTEQREKKSTKIEMLILTKFKQLEI